jgi:ABC-type polar amino acid transport system ATPase subunit
MEAGGCMTATQPTFSVRGFAVRRGGRLLVSDVTIEGRPGELIALRGPSGSGKTTILRSMAGLDPFESGTIDVGDAHLEGGRPPHHLTQHRIHRNVGLVFQFHCLFEHLSVLQNVCLAPIHVYGTPAGEADRRARSLLAELGVDSLAAALPRELSGGEAQRVAIARALAVDPPVLLMDEPMASLDPVRRGELGGLLQRLAGAGRTLLVTSHDERFAAQFATRTLSIEDGRVCQAR